MKKIEFRKIRMEDIKKGAKDLQVCEQENKKSAWFR